MTVIPTFECDDCGEEFGTDIINSYQVRTPGHGHDVFEPPVILRVDICDGCIEFKAQRVVYVAWDDEEQRAVGVKTVVRPFSGDSYHTYDERGGAPLGARWDRFFDQLDRVIENEWSLDAWEVDVNEQ